jgi:hypothetical protein
MLMRRLVRMAWYNVEQSFVRWVVKRISGEGLMLKVRQAQQHLQQEPSNIDSITDLVEISVWLGTYRERMRLARSEDQQELADNARHWTA